MMSGDDAKRENDEPAPGADIPEVDAEVVEDAPAENAEPFDEPVAETQQEMPRRSIVSPGVLAFAGLVLVAIAAGVYWYVFVDKHPRAETIEPVIEAGNEAAAPAPAPSDTDDKVANADMSGVKDAPAVVQTGADIAEATGDLTTPAERVENAGLSEDAKEAAGAGVDETAQPASEDETAPLSFELEQAVPGDDEPLNAAPAGEGDGVERIGGHENNSITNELPSDETLDAVDAPVTDVGAADPATNAAAEESNDVAAQAELESMLANERARLDTLQSEIDSVRSDLAAANDALRIVRSEASSAETEIRALRAENDRLKQVRQQAPLADAAIALNAIEKAAAAGAPFESALASLEPTNPNAGAVAALIPHAAGGAPTLSALREEFSGAAREALAAANRENASGVVERYGARIGALFNIRPAEPQPGATPAAVISRAEYAVEQGDLTAAIDELAGLPPGARAAMGDWTEKAQTRAKIDDALRLLNAELVEKAAQPESL